MHIVVPPGDPALVSVSLDGVEDVEITRSGGGESSP